MLVCANEWVFYELLNASQQQFLAGIIFTAGPYYPFIYLTPSQSLNAKPMPLSADNNKQNVAFIISVDKQALLEKSKLAALSLTAYFSSNFLSTLHLYTEIQISVSTAQNGCSSRVDLVEGSCRNISGLPKDGHNECC